MNQIIKNTIILFVITLVAGICLGTVHDITLDPIAQAQEAAATKTYQEVYPDAASFDEPQELADAVTAAADSISDLEKLPSMMQKKRWMQAATRSVT